jgi:hypothetical protein
MVALPGFDRSIELIAGLCDANMRRRRAKMLDPDRRIA